MYCRQVCQIYRGSAKIEGGFSVNKAVMLLRKADAIVMDVDSTIIRKEGIDMLAQYLHKEHEIRALKGKLVHRLFFRILGSLLERSAMKNSQAIRCPS